MARTKGFDEQQALDKAMQVFWAKGFEAASVADLLAGTGLNRGSLYGTFGDKRALFLKALRRYDCERRRPLLASLEALDDPSLAIAGFFDALIKETVQDEQRKGCFLINTALELAMHDHDVQVLVNEGISEIEGFLKRCIELGQIRSLLPLSLAPADAAKGLLAAVIGIRVLGREVFDEAALRTMADQAQSVLVWRGEP